MNDLLKVLDMSEDEQYYWVCQFHAKYHFKISLFPDNHEEMRKELADLAFRLRDEAVAKNHADFHNAIYNIMVKVEGDNKWATAFWGECLAKPIHWIIAALIAKEQDNE